MEAGLGQANADLRKRIELAAGILKSLDQRSKLTKQAVPQAGSILDPFSGLLMTKPPKHDGVAGGLFWRLSAVHWQLGQAGKQPAKSAPATSTGGLPVDPIVAGQVQAVKTIALTGKIHDDILKLKKNADESFGRAAKTLWGRNEKPSSIALEGFHKESIAGLKKAADLLGDGLKAYGVAQQNYFLKLGQAEKSGDSGKKGRVALGGAGGSAGEGVRTKNSSVSGKGSAEQGTSTKTNGVDAVRPASSGKGGEGPSAFGALALGKGGARVALAAASQAEEELPRDLGCLNANALSDRLTACNFDVQCENKVWKDCLSIREKCSNADAVLAKRKGCFDDALSGAGCPKCSGDQLNQRYFKCRDDTAKLCVSIGSKPPVKCTEGSALQITSSLTPPVTAVKGKKIVFTVPAPSCPNTKISWKFMGAATMGKVLSGSGATTTFTPGTTPGKAKLTVTGAKGASKSIDITVVQVKLTAPKPISYGGKDDGYICATILPAGSEPYVDYQIDPKGALERSIVAPPKNCAKNQTEFKIQSSLVAPCLNKVSFSSKLRTTGDPLATAPVTVMRPNKTEAMPQKILGKILTRNCYPGGTSWWWVKFMSTDGKTPKFDGLPNDELITIVDGCHISLKPTTGGGTIGPPFEHNTADDTNSMCGVAKNDCTEVYMQSVQIGQCKTPPNAISYRFDHAGNMTLTRRDQTMQLPAFPAKE